MKETPITSNEKKTWHKPELKDLGNFRSFVKWGESHGKTPAEGDGNSGEAMI